MYKQKTWQHEITGTEGNVILFGVNIFEYNWQATGKRIKVKDPLYNQEYIFPIYNVIIEEKEFTFAAGEFSNAVYGFYVLKF